jgi:hypothetical protein
MQHSAESIFIIEILREYEFIFEKALTHESGGPGVLIDKKNWGSKISWHCPFKQVKKLKVKVIVQILKKLLNRLKQFHLGN